MRNFLLAACGLSLLVSGCATDTSETHACHHTPARANETTEPREHQPRVGMSKQAVREMYGEPASIVHTAKGEVWRYWFNKQSTIWLGSRPRVAAILFNYNGKVENFVWNE